MPEKTKNLTKLMREAAKKARAEIPPNAEGPTAAKESWPVDCTIGPGLEGAIACYTKIGHVNGGQGILTYRGYNIFDLAASSTFEEVAYLLLFGRLPTPRLLEWFKNKLGRYRHLPQTLRMLQGFPVEQLNPMGGLRLGVNLLRRVYGHAEDRIEDRDKVEAIHTDDDSIPEETLPEGHEHAVFEVAPHESALEDIYHLISGTATLTAAISRLREGKLPIEPRDDLSHAANFLYMMTGREPTPQEARIMDVCLILHADHGMNASTFSSMVVASTLSDIYFSIGAGIAALNGPLHGGANEHVLYMLEEIQKVKDVKAWYKKARRDKRKIVGFGHRVYKTYDPRARILAPLAEHVAEDNKEIQRLFRTARSLEKEVVRELGSSKGIFPNVDFYSGLVYRGMGIPTPMFTPIFAVSRVAGWTARVLEYLQNNRIFRPRAFYIGKFDEPYVPLEKRGGKKKSARKKR